jgi:hypothetical protein
VEKNEGSVSTVEKKEGAAAPPPRFRAPSAVKKNKATVSPRWRRRFRVSAVEKVNATAVERRGGGRISMGSAAAVEKKLMAAINLGFGSHGGEEADGGD